MIYKINDEILQTVDFRLLTSKYNNLSLDLKVLTVYPGIQERICSLSDNELKYLDCAVKYAKKLGIEQEVVELMEVLL